LAASAFSKAVWLSLRGFALWAVETQCAVRWTSLSVKSRKGVLPTFRKKTFENQSGTRQDGHLQTRGKEKAPFFGHYLLTRRQGMGVAKGDVLLLGATTYLLLLHNLFVKIYFCQQSFLFLRRSLAFEFSNPLLFCHLILRFLKGFRSL
jgi:hypothetical protein